MLIGHFPHGIKEERGRGLYTTRYTLQDEIRQFLTNFRTIRFPDFSPSSLLWVHGAIAHHSSKVQKRQINSMSPLLRRRLWGGGGAIKQRGSNKSALLARKIQHQATNQPPQWGALFCNTLLLLGLSLTKRLWNHMHPRSKSKTGFSCTSVDACLFPSFFNSPSLNILCGFVLWVSRRNNKPIISPWLRWCIWQTLLSGEGKRDWVWNNVCVFFSDGKSWFLEAKERLLS